MNEQSEKLQKVLARAALGSRREMEAAISRGQVTVNGKVATIGDRVGRDDKIIYQGRTVKNDGHEQKLRVILYNKPEGEICSRSDPEGRPTVFRRLPTLRQGRWMAVGRLDFNTSGLLLFVSDGELANRLMHPSSNVEREYLVRVFGEVDESMLQRLKEGILLDDGPAKFTHINATEHQRSNRWYYCGILEGRNREVRRLWESQGVKVNRLKRVRYGNLMIPSYLKPGQWIELSPLDIKQLAASVDFRIANKRLDLNQDDKEKIQRRDRQLRRGGGRPKKP
jgi:23S rRNA pseudouridine2605 synthase